MKLLFFFVVLSCSACATRHMPQTDTWFVDCYNKSRIEEMLARSESHLADNDYEERRKIRKMFWELQKKCS